MSISPRRDPTASRRIVLDLARRQPWGTAYLTGNILLAPRLGAAGLVGLVVTGQLLFAVLADNRGWLGFEPHHATIWRGFGCMLMMGGVLLIAKS